MVSDIVGLALKGVSKLIDVLTKFLTNSLAISITDEQGNKKYLSLAFGSPIKINKNKEIGLVILGNVDQSVIQKIEKDIEAGIALTKHSILEKKFEKDIQKEKAEILEKKFEGYQPVYPEAFDFGRTIAFVIYKQKYMRKDIGSTTKVKGIKWEEENYNELVLAHEDKYNGIGYSSKISRKGKNWIIPMEAVKIWQHIRYYSGEEAEVLSKQLYEGMKADSKEIKKEVRKKIKEYIKQEESKKKN